MTSKSPIHTAESSHGIWLSELLEGFSVLNSEFDRIVSALQLSSQKVEQGDLFVALPGVTADGRDYIDSAIMNQASAVIFEKLGSDRKDEVIDGVPIIGVEGLKKKLGRLSLLATIIIRLNF